MPTAVAVINGEKAVEIGLISEKLLRKAHSTGKWISSRKEVRVEHPVHRPWTIHREDIQPGFIDGSRYSICPNPFQPIAVCERSLETGCFFEPRDNGASLLATGRLVGLRLGPINTKLTRMLSRVKAERDGAKVQKWVRIKRFFGCG